MLESLSSGFLARVRAIDVDPPGYAWDPEWAICFRGLARITVPGLTRGNGYESEEEDRTHARAGGKHDSVENRNNFRDTRYHNHLKIDPLRRNVEHHLHVELYRNPEVEKAFLENPCSRTSAARKDKRKTMVLERISTFEECCPGSRFLDSLEAGSYF